MAGDIDVIRRGFEIFNRRDWSAIPEFVHPDAEWRPPRDLPGSELYHGPEGAEKSMRDLFEAFENLRAEPHDVYEAGEGKVVALYVWRGSSVSGVSLDPFEVHVSCLFELRDGLVVKAEFFNDWETAPRLAGVEPGSASTGSG
jgi:ketosteroid isomerase-like protein